MNKSDKAAQKCLENGLGMPSWREQMEERFGEIKGRFYQNYGGTLSELKIANAAQFEGFRRESHI